MDDEDLFEAVKDDLDGIKQQFRKQTLRKGLIFDEDIFSDTLAKCNKVFRERKMDRKTGMSYFWSAFKTNTLRERNYSRNKYRVDSSMLDYLDVLPESNEDVFDAVKDIIVKKFGEDAFNLFLAHACGATYDELEDENKRNDLRYLFRKIRDFVRKSKKYLF